MNGDASARDAWWDAHRKGVYLAIFVIVAGFLTAFWGMGIGHAFGVLPVVILATVALVSVGAVVVVYWLLSTRSIDFARLFLIPLCLFGLCQMVVFGPLKIADEVDHWLAAYWYSNVLLGTDAPEQMNLRAEDVAIYEMDPLRKGDEAHLLVEMRGGGSWHR